jgi:YD repeat-containing protein
MNGRMASMRRWRSLALILALSTGVASRSWAQSLENDPTRLGRIPQHGTFSLLPWESIDTYTGNAILTFKDLVLPGNGGYDLEIVRTYNTLDQGWRWLLAPTIGVSNVSPTLIHPDGHLEYLLATPTPDVYMTTSLWRVTIGESGCTAELPDGIVWHFDADGQATSREDPFGNAVEVVRAPGVGRITALVQHLGGGQTRTVSFDYEPGVQDLLSTMTYTYVVNGEELNRVWHYNREWAYLDGGWAYLLTSAQPPEGSAWTFDYTWHPWQTSSDRSSQSITVTTPGGGRVDYYSEDGQRFNDCAPEGGCTVRPIGWADELRLRTRESGGSGIQGGTWTFSYLQRWYPDLSHDYLTTVEGPPVPDHAFQATYIHQPLNATLSMRTLVGSSVGTTAETLETTSLAWGNGVELGTVPPDTFAENHVPLLTSMTTTRDGHSYTRGFDYEPDSWNHFGQPTCIAETGDFTRYFRLEYRLFPIHLADRVNSEVISSTPTICAPEPTGGEFESSYEYDDQGFMFQKTIHGITTSYGRSPSGNLQTLTNANQRQTTLSHSWGVQADTVTPEFTISRAINEDGTVASETRQAQTITYKYDRMGRQTKATPPHYGNPTDTSYHDNSIVVTRGSSSVTTSLDGFGRPVGTTNAEAVQTAIDYDAFGRKRTESVPFDGTYLRKDTEYTYDALGRVTLRSNPDSTSVSYRYDAATDGLTVQICDEKRNGTTQTWASSGSPDSARLAKVNDPTGTDWSYEYDLLGALTKVHEPGGVTREWQYNANHRVEAETHPESGRTEYEYDDVGNLLWKKEAVVDGTPTRTVGFRYDHNNRRTYAGDLGTDYEYDDWDRRTRANRLGVVDTRFDWDDDGRLRNRTDTFTAGGAQRVLQSGYRYDNNDNVLQVSYPNGNRACYDYDAANRVNKVWRTAEPVCPADPPADAVYFAKDVTYHPSGAIHEYTSGPPGHEFRYTFGFDDRHRVTSIAAPGFLNLGYGYDDAGNVESISDARPDLSATYSYDTLDRLQTATGVWGSTTYQYEGTEGSAGNRTKQTHNGVDTSFAYLSAAPRRLHAVGSSSYVWNEYGDLTDDGIYTYAYSLSHMLVEVTRKADQTKLYYGYDGEDQRLWYTPQPVQKSIYYVRGIGGLLSEYELAVDQFTWEVDYVYLGSRLLAALRPDRSVSVTVTFPGGGSGRVQSTAPTGLDCTGAPCSVRFDGSVTLQATPAVGSRFVGWEEGCHGTQATVTLTLTADVTCAARFEAVPLLTWTDDPLVAQQTEVKAQHFLELRQSIDTLRGRYGLTASAWSVGLAAGEEVKGVYLTELRTALGAAYAAAGRTAPTYTDFAITPGVTEIKAAHIMEIRAAVVALW